ncbi:hypothetical protein LAZ67_23000910 [Cordylochernes scorpioides]|uniref:HTH CENPB-type domain-containing protein n=1 Tax=Cordylochernes scorpioides TaxID=51811 RepID=A0ABY6LQ99_9ARAC|nr:hypothetical protein LAZ67_23000910 [Cordylochernes scorpioides]
MGPVKKYVEREMGEKKDIITMEAKRKMIEKHERGMRVTEIARFYKKSTSTICTILKKKKELRELDAAKGVTRLSKQRPRLLEEVENLILVWINEKQLAGDTITQNLIYEKEKALYAELGSKIPCTSIENEVHADFKASKGWFENFKRRSGIHSVTRHGEGASSDAKAAETFTAEFEKLVVTECYLPQQYRVLGDNRHHSVTLTVGDPNPLPRLAKDITGHSMGKQHFADLEVDVLPFATTRIPRCPRNPWNQPHRADINPDHKDVIPHQGKNQHNIYSGIYRDEELMQRGRKTKLRGLKRSDCCLPPTPVYFLEDSRRFYELLSPVLLILSRTVVQLMLGFHRRAKAKTSLEDDDVPIDDTTTKPLFTPQENGRKDVL